MKAHWIAATLLNLAAAGSASAESLPEGRGKALVEGACSACHALDQISRGPGFTRADWDALTATMIDLSASPTERTTMLDYLTAHFPPNAGHAATPVDGPLKLTFKAWVVPTLGQRARDPVEAPDGTIWWAGQWGNLVGRLDPRTGAMREYPLPDGAMPHSVTVDGAGGVWYTGNKNGTIGKLDPETGNIPVFTMPDPAAKDPHTAVFDADGILWFTLQQSNMVGRLDPATGAVKLVAAKTPRSRPYGIVVDADGAPWFACNGSNCLVKVDPQTMALTEFKLPDPATTVRRLDIAPDGMIWYVNSGRGRLGRLDPKTGVVKEWPSPSGPASHPYALAIVDGIVWYNESGVRPDMLVRFDPKTEGFQSWPIPSGSVYAGIVRHMRPTRNGDLLIHQTSTNRIIRVSLPPTER